MRRLLDTRVTERALSSVGSSEVGRSLYPLLRVVPLVNCPAGRGRGVASAAKFGVSGVLGPAVKGDWRSSETGDALLT